MYDTQGDYVDAFLILAGLNLLGAVCFLLARRAPASQPPSGPCCAGIALTVVRPRPGCLACNHSGWISDVRGEYTVAFVVLAGLNLIGVVCFLSAKRPAGIPAPGAESARPAAG